mmetsp:Transcript_52330/g.87413  ORF Transcript_52330/g.87413 Transcript_52330/m.87413 type:complete len:225 (+) Transcript_52330:986-1660(+)
MEQCQRNHGLGNTNSLSTENTTETELLAVSNHLATCFGDRDSLASNGGGLHDHLQARQGVSQPHVDGAHCSRGQQASCEAAQRRLGSQLLLDELLQLWLPDKTKGCAGQGVSHQWHGATEQGTEVLGGTLPENIHDWLGCASLLEVGTLLLLDHTDGVDERSREDGGTRGSNHSDVISVTTEEGNAQQQSELGNSLGTNANQPRTHTRQGGRDGRLHEHSLRFS